VRLRTGTPEQHKEEHAMGSGNKSTFLFGLRDSSCSMPYFRLSNAYNDTVGFVWRTVFFMLLLLVQ
jgi:hypothetical protein